MNMEAISGHYDLALIALWGFWLFFAYLVYWLQRENMREGYPLEDEKGGPAVNQGWISPPEPKSFKLPHGRGEVMKPGANDGDTRSFAMEPVDAWSPGVNTPTGNPLVDGVGAAAWAERRDEPELDGHGHPKIIPLRSDAAFSIAYRQQDPRGYDVVAADEGVVGTIKDAWIDRPEQLIRYLEIDLKSGGSCLVPMPLVRLWEGKAHVGSLMSDQFADAPKIKSDSQITMLEEEKVSAYFTGGKLYASNDRVEPLII